MEITGTLFGLAKTKNEIDSVEIFKSMMLEVNASGAVVMDGRNIAAGSIYANQLSANSITASKIKAGEITTDHITTSGISADKIKAGTLTATNGDSWINMNNGQFSFGNGKIVYNGSTLAINVESLSITNNPVATKNDVNTVVGEKITAEEKRAIDDANAKLDTAKKHAEDKILEDKLIKDTRNDNQLPNWYFANYPRQIVREFKYATTVGITGESGYGILTTDVPWTESSGGSIKQEFRVGNKTYKRSGLTTSWTAWQDYDGLAESAQTDATNAKNSASAANQLLADLSNDNILTPVEKKSIKKEWDIIVSEKVKIDVEATEYGISTEKVNYNNHYTSLNTYITPLLSNLNTNSTIVAETFRAYFKNYYDARQDVLNAITSKAKILADSAQGTADTIKGVVSNFDSSIINANPIFLDWSGTLPTGYESLSGSGLSKVVSSNGMGNALRFTVPSASNSYLNPSVVTTFPFFEYITIETTFKLDSGTIDGAGVLFRYRGTGITDEYVKIKDIIPSPVLNKWYTITKVLKRAEPAGFTGYQVYPMGGFTSFGTITAKVIQFDSLKTRKSTEQEINAYESSIMIDDMSVDSKITPVEKVQLKKEWATIASERSSLDGKAATFGITTEKTNMTNAYNTLNSVLNGTSGILTNMKTTSTVTATTFRAQFDDYYEKKAILQRKIDETSRTLANTATDLAQAMTTGKIMYKDPTFKSGANGIMQYNNSGGTTVTVTRVAKPADAPTTSAYAMKISTAGTASPGLGGYYQGVMARANAKFVVRIIAKIPTGYSLSLASNAMGTGYVDKLITSDAGTGKYEEYIRVIQCGSTGTFSSGGHFYLSGSPNGTAAAPVDWYLAYATVFDITDMDYTIYDIENLANATKDKTDAWTYTGTVEINGGKIRADTVTATQIAANTITANQIATNAIISDKILANSITTAKIATNAVTANEIAANTITANEIKANTITASQIAANTITASQIAATTITANQIATNAITADKVIANAITTAKIATNAVTANEILAGTITANEIKTRTLTADKIVAGSLTSNEIAANSITIGNINPQAFSQGYVTTNPIFSNWVSTYPLGYAAWASSVGLPIKETTLIKNGGFGVRFSVTVAGSYSGIALSSAGTINNQVKPEYLVIEMDFMLVSGTLSGAGMLVDWTGMSGTNRVSFSLASEISSPTLNKWYSVRKVIKAPAATGTFSTITGFLMANFYPELGAGAVKNIIFDRVALREPSIEEINSYEGNVSNAVTTINNEGVTVKDGSFYLEDNSSSVKYSMQTKTNPIRDHSFELLIPTFRHDTLDMWTIDTYGNANGTASPNGGSDLVITGTPYLYIDYIKDTNSNSASTPIFGSTSGVVNNGSYFSAKVWNFVKPGKKYTFSAFFKKMPGAAGGTPRMSIQHVTGANDVVAATLATPIFQEVTSEIDAVRYSTTFTVPANYSITNTDEIKMSVLSGNANWVMVDGMQLTDAEYPSQYNDEKTAFDIARGSILFPVFEAEQVYVKGLTVGGFISATEYVSQTVLANQNLNSYVKAGFYYCATSAVATTISNTPTNMAFSLFVEVHAGYKQTFTEYKDNNPKTFIRNHYNGYWGKWDLVAYDTGWITMPLASGFTGNLQARQVANTVHFRGKFSGKTSSGGNINICVLPSNVARPGVNTDFEAATALGATSGWNVDSAGIYMRASDGQLMLGRAIASATNYDIGSMSYGVG